MRVLFVHFLFFISVSALSQSGQIVGQIERNNDPFLEYIYLTAFLKQGDSIIKRTIPDQSGVFKFGEINKGIYSLTIRQIGYRDFVTDSLQIQGDTILQLNLKYPPTCIYIYSKDQKPTCINGHSDKIIPIVYGLPTKKTMNKAKKGLVKLAGCIVSVCDPHYYCSIHKIEL
jgi:hypothetical protein